MYTKNAECDVSMMEDAIIIMKKDDNSLHVFNETASLIWEHIESCSIDDMAKIIMTKYTDVSIDVVMQDINNMINIMLEKNLIFVR